MNLLKLFSVVVAAHLAVVGILLVQSGCQSLSDDSSSAEDAKPMGASVSSSHDTYSDSIYTDVNEVDASDETVTQASTLRRPPTRPTWNLSSSNAQAELVAESSTTEMVVLQPVAPDVQTTSSTPQSFDYTVQRGDTLWGISKQHGVSVNSIASASGIQANAPLKVGQVLQIPGGSGQASMQSPSTQQAPGADYTVQRGDTLSSISQRYHVSVRSLKQANGLTSDRIRVGQTLSIPGSGSTSSVTNTSTPQATQISTQSNSTTHEVQRGETLSVIATRYGVSVSDLMAWNGIEDPRRLQVGQELVLHASGKVPASTPQAVVASSTENVEEVSVPVVETVEIETVEEESLPEDFGDDSIFDSSDSVPVVPIESTQS